WVQVNGSGITNCGDFFGGCGTQQGAYNLTLAAAPNGTATDLYAGAINLYKCTITNAFPTCNGSGSNTFQNLTHVYGCSDIAKVHPDQHAIDFQISNGAALLFFANDGGIYRALDGFTGLTTGVCGLANKFERRTRPNDAVHFPFRIGDRSQSHFWRQSGQRRARDRLRPERRKLGQRECGR